MVVVIPIAILVAFAGCRWAFSSTHRLPTVWRVALALPWVLANASWATSAYFHVGRLSIIFFVIGWAAMIPIAARIRQPRCTSCSEQRCSHRARGSRFCGTIAGSLEATMRCQTHPPRYHGNRRRAPRRCVSMTLLASRLEAQARNRAVLTCGGGLAMVSLSSNTRESYGNERSTSRKRHFLQPAGTRRQRNRRVGADRVHTRRRHSASAQRPLTRDALLRLTARARTLRLLRCAPRGVQSAKARSARISPRRAPAWRFAAGARAWHDNQ